MLVTLTFGLWRRRRLLIKFLNDLGSKSVIGWGNKPNTIRARAYAHKHHLPFVTLEDGFLRSMGLGVSGDEPLSLVVDDLGIYYDASKTSRLEQLIIDHQVLQPHLEEGARALALIRKHHLTKYNYLPVGWPEALSLDTTKSQLLIIDQTFGDMSLQYGGVSPNTFIEMLAQAKKEHPESHIWIKIHPDVLAGKRAGHFTDLMPQLQQDPQVTLLTEDIHPHSLLEKMDQIYVATSQMGFEALMLGKKVTTFGVPWYAGWGLTEDRHPNVLAADFQSRRSERSLLALFTASYLQYCRYLNPYTGKRGTIFDVIDYLVMMKRREALIAGEIWCVGLSLWKRQIIRPFIQGYNNQLRFFRTPKQLQKAYQSLPIEARKQNIRLLLWGKKFPELAEWANRVQLPILRMEDGFIRSVGLGSNLVPPRSLVLDDLGIYFDASTPSRLEQILAESLFDPSLLQEAEQLQAALIANKMGKYNVGRQDCRLPNVGGKPILLVPGQVEDDASIQTGTRDIKTNLGLLTEVRRQNPHAYIVYKPHPDVVSGNRVGIIAEDEALRYADIIMDEADIISLIEQCDELHTMTSLSGFEALLRGKKVSCYGIPFYAGWGLTEDRYTLENRRGRALTLSELIAGTLILYPTYLDLKTGKMTNALSALQALTTEREAVKQSNTIHSNWPERKWQQFKGLIQTLKW
ncbi:capsule polysaccharide modification protein LipA [Ignatzschineria ureiclastica]|uniref:capsular polysaccharide biosynthesis protein n=1 Tax=Ignatzschineria ureiclastica TaxID=472582 RepID=UPI001675F080|nr:capsular polysaccharide biosynthesis protein [Ignatzschineria ureiclastica]GHA01288.1 capsule polysaccharide modification protein LipA [Ignatzschineria ureiclastica]